MKEEQVKQAVRNRYGKLAREGAAGCGCDTSSNCCGSGSAQVAQDLSRKIGYSHEELESVPEGANLGLGCGNPVGLATLKEGEMVLDLGSGPGFDCFLAAARVGHSGRVIGVDMTADMLVLARSNAEHGGYKNVEFRLGEIEHLPVADNSVDAVISNCVINLAPDKAQVFREAFRVLRPGGRMMVSDMVLNGELPADIKGSLDAYTSCVAGAAQKKDYMAAIKTAGFKDVKIVQEDFFSPDTLQPDVVKMAAAAVSSVQVQANKPK